MRKNNNVYEDAFTTWMEIYNFWLNRLYDMAYTCIDWKGFNVYGNNSVMSLPEKYLIDNGMCCVFYDEVVGEYACLPCVGSHSLDINGQPSYYTAYGTNGYFKENLRNGKDAVVIYNNPAPHSEHLAIAIYAKRLTNSMVTGDVNLSTHKTPFVITCDEEQKLTAKNMFEEVVAGVPIIFGNDSLRMIKMDVLKLDTPYIVDKITENTQVIWNEWLNYLGVPSQVVQKKERMIKDEVTQTMGGALASRVPRMLMREKASDSLNKVFGMSTEPEYVIDRTPIPQYLKEKEIEDEAHITTDRSYENN